MKLKKYYYLVFYELYCFYQKGPSVWLSEWKANASMGILFLFFISSVLFYYRVFIDHKSFVGERGELVVLAVIITTINYFIFNHKNRWKLIVNGFRNSGKKKDRIRGGVVFIIILIIMLNLVFSYYLLFKMYNK